MENRITSNWSIFKSRISDNEQRVFSSFFSYFIDACKTIFYKYIDIHRILNCIQYYLWAIKENKFKYCGFWVTYLLAQFMEANHKNKNNLRLNFVNEKASSKNWMMKTNLHIVIIKRFKNCKGAQYARRSLSKNQK